jgi:hypothetical protein
MDLLRRYFNLLKITMISFILSTCIHVGIVAGYYWTFLYMNPDDPGKKKFYSTTTSTGVNIGGKVVGGGGIQTNHHKSYLLHLIREHYKSLSKLFFIEFSAIYCFILYLFKFFPERSRLQEETMSAFKSIGEDDAAEPRTVVRMVKQQGASRLQSAASLLRKRTIMNRAIRQLEEIDEYETDNADQLVDGGDEEIENEEFEEDVVDQIDAAENESMNENGVEAKKDN